jgi:hypothetical protein
LVRYYGAYSNASRGKRKKEKIGGGEEVNEKPDIIEVTPPPVSKELKKRWSYFIRKVYETDPLVCPKCSSEMRIISFIDQGAVIKTILQHLGLWEESLRLGSGQAHALRGEPQGRTPPDGEPPKREITFDPSYSQLI